MDHHAALIYVMVLVSAADSDMTDAELETMGEIVRYLPIFKDFDRDRLTEVAGACAEVLKRENGLDEALAAVKEALPEKLYETAYAVACDVAAADGKVSQEELRLLEMIRHRLGIGRLVAAAVERASRARHTVL